MRKEIAIAALALVFGATSTLALPVPVPAQPQAAQGQNAVQIVNQPQAQVTSSNSAKVVWTTNVNSGGIVKYGTDPNNLNQTANAPWGGTTHEVTLTNLQPNTTYYYQAVSQHGQGTGTGALSPVQQFSTQGQSASGSAGNPSTTGQAKAGDNVVILAGPVVQDLQGNTAKLWWQTDDMAATDVRYGLSPNSMDQRAYERGGNRDHSVQLTNLQPGRAYYYAILKRDGSVRTTGQFQTPQNMGSPVNANAMITNGPVIEYLGDNRAVISWTTAAPASSVVQYGTDQNAMTQMAQAQWGTNHRVELNNLQPNTRYYFQVQSAQSQGTNQMAQGNTGQFQTVGQGQQALTTSPQRR
ncbi:MAG TPA: fibronectin type III domain-containing protein [Clostridia bacterium]|nr:fibronectin type III domain-containing protein [Clostridia bacterium]